MSLDGLLLEKLARWRPDGRQILEMADPVSGRAVTVTADAADLVGCRLWELSLRGPAIVSELQDRAEAVAGRVTGLLEPLRVIEVDAPRGVALLRSDEPTRRGEAASYYELLLYANGGAQFRRYESPHGEERRRLRIDYTLTHDALGKLVADLSV
jgi:hypothetical protein